MRASWLMLAMAVGVAGGLFIRHRIKMWRNRIAEEPEDWPNEKNFGAFPPEIPDAIFDGLS